MDLTDPLFRRRIQEWASGCMADLKRVNSPTYRTLCLEKWLKELRVEIIRPTIETKLHRREKDDDLQIWGSIVYYQSCREIEGRIRAEVPVGMMDAPLFSQLKPTEEQLVRIKLMQTAPLFKEVPKTSADAPTNSPVESETIVNINSAATLQKTIAAAVSLTGEDAPSTSVITKTLGLNGLVEVYIPTENGMYTIKYNGGPGSVGITTPEGTRNFGVFDLNDPVLGDLAQALNALNLVVTDANEAAEILENIQNEAAETTTSSTTPSEEATMNTESTTVTGEKPNVVTLHNATALAFIMLLGLAAVILGVALGQLALLLSGLLAGFMPALAAQILSMAVVIVGVVGLHALTGAMNYVVGGALWVSNFLTVTAPKWIVGLFRKDDAVPAAA